MNATTVTPEVTGFERIRVPIGSGAIAAHFDSWASSRPGGPDEVTITFNSDVADVEIPLDQADDAIAALRGWVNRIAAVVESTRIYHRAAELGQVPLLGTLISVLRSSDPIASLEWLLSVESDEDTRHGLAAALEALRARGDGGQ